MVENNLNDLTESFSIRLSKRVLSLLEKISDARGCSSSDFIRSLLRAGFRKLAYLTEEEKKAVGEICPVCGGKL